MARSHAQATKTYLSMRYFERIAIVYSSQPFSQWFKEDNKEVQTQCISLYHSSMYWDWLCFANVLSNECSGTIGWGIFHSFNVLARAILASLKPSHVSSMAKRFGYPIQTFWVGSKLDIYVTQFIICFITDFLHTTTFVRQTLQSLVSLPRRCTFY